MAFFKKRQKVEESTPIPKIETVYFTTTGTKYDNPDGSKRTDVLEALAQDFEEWVDPEDFFNGYTNKEIKEDDLSVGKYEGFTVYYELEEYDYQGDLAYYIHTNKGIVGVVPAKIVPRLHELLEQEWNSIELHGTLCGGKTKYYDWDSEKVEIEDEPYSLDCSAKFYPKK